MTPAGVASGSDCDFDFDLDGADVACAKEIPVLPKAFHADETIAAALPVRERVVMVDVAADFEVPMFELYGVGLAVLVGVTELEDAGADAVGFGAAPVPGTALPT